MPSAEEGDTKKRKISNKEEISVEELEARRKEWEKIEGITRHIRLVQDNCFKLAKGLHALGETEFARKLIARSMVHDNSKFSGIEWAYLHRGVEDQDAWKLAHMQHVSTNDHHPEFYENTDHSQMSRLAVAEMICDWKARSDEFGSDLKSWINECAYPRYNIPKSGKIAKWIKGFLEILLDKPFQSI